jgi:hypothetical protein
MTIIYITLITIAVLVLAAEIWAMAFMIANSGMSRRRVNKLAREALERMRETGSL